MSVEPTLESSAERFITKQDERNPIWTRYKAIEHTFWTTEGLADMAHRRAPDARIQALLHHLSAGHPSLQRLILAILAKVQLAEARSHLGWQYAMISIHMEACFTLGGVAPLCSAESISDMTYQQSVLELALNMSLMGIGSFAVMAYTSAGTSESVVDACKRMWKDRKAFAEFALFFYNSYIRVKQPEPTILLATRELAHREEKFVLELSPRPEAADSICQCIHWTADKFLHDIGVLKRPLGDSPAPPGWFSSHGAGASGASAGASAGASGVAGTPKPKFSAAPANEFCLDADF